MTTPAPLLEAPDTLDRLADLPMRLTAILGRTRTTLGALAQAASGSVFELDRMTGEAVDILVNDRLIGRGEIVTVGDRLGITITEVFAETGE